ncbi:MAG: sugar phosphate isomerase/epimerase family protein [Clostridia bacterium]
MNVGYMTNAWGHVVGHPKGLPSVKDLFYLSTGSIEEAVEVIGKTGFERIEIFDGNLYSYMDRKLEFSDLLKKNHIKLSAVYTAANFIFDEILEEEFYKMDKAIEAAKVFGAKHLIVGGGAVRRDGIRESDFSKLAKGLDRVVDICEEKGLMASYHHHLGSMIETEEQLDKLMAQTKIRICVDTGHIHGAGGDALAVVERYADRIYYMHLKDYKNGSFCPLGKGVVDFEGIFKILLQHKNKVDFTVEANDIGEDLVQLAKHSYQFLEKYFA